MLKSQLNLQTQEAERIIKRLAKHWSHKMQIETKDNQTIIPFSQNDMAILSFDNENLFVSLTTQDIETQQKLQDVVLNHINRMAGVEFDTAWQNL